MKIKQIWVVAAWMVSSMSVNAQEYLNISGVRQSYYFPLEEVDSVTIEIDSDGIMEQMKNDGRIKLYYEALQATGIDSLLNYSLYDTNYDSRRYGEYRYFSDFWREVATVPDYKRHGFTLFVTPDEVLNAKGIHSLEELYRKACGLYDPIYPKEVGEACHTFDELKDEQNPLNRYMRYTILKCDVGSLDRLTGLILNQGIVNGVIGIKTDLVNPTDWYQTLLPHTLMKCEMLTVKEYAGAGTLGEYYINRCYNDTYQIEGTAISRSLPNEEAGVINGRYFYVNDLVAYTSDVRDKVQNNLIRMDFSTVFPELTTHEIRLNGDPTKDDNSSVADLTFANGRNYYFPDGYLDGVTLNNDTKLIYRRPHWNFWGYQGDNFNLFGDYDFTFRLPPVPFSGEWQIRLGFCALQTRGSAQIYVDDVEYGEPIDFTLFLDDETLLGRSMSDYLTMTDEEKIAEQKKLREMGIYRAPRSTYHTDGNLINEFITNPRTYRRVLYQGELDCTQDHFLRIKYAVEPLVGNSLEFHLDYIELVPKSVYDVPDDQMEDDL